jgi:hypothetical protein
VGRCKGGAGGKSEKRKAKENDAEALRSRGERSGEKRKTGKRKTGKRKTGKRKTGKRKTGKRKTGKRKSGPRSAGPTGLGEGAIDTKRKRRRRGHDLSCPDRFGGRGGSGSFRGFLGGASGRRRTWWLF